MDRRKRVVDPPARFSETSCVNDYQSPSPPHTVKESKSENSLANSAGVLSTHVYTLNPTKYDGFGSLRQNVESHNTPPRIPPKREPKSEPLPMRTKVLTPTSFKMVHSEASTPNIMRVKAPPPPLNLDDSAFSNANSPENNLKRTSNYQPPMQRCKSTDMKAAFELKLPSTPMKRPQVPPRTKFLSPQERQIENIHFKERSLSESKVRN